MFRLPSPIEKIKHPLLDAHGVTLFIKRDDLIHSEISGNKWRKLKYNFEDAINKGEKGIITCGGAYSNHIAATAAAGNHFGIKTTGIIRGEELHSNSNSTLQKAYSNGMKFQFVSRAQYREIKSDENWMKSNFPGLKFVPEGGTNSLAIKGAAEIISETEMDFDIIISSLGTGGTLAGIIKGLKGQKHAFGFSSLKGEFVQSDFSQLLQFEGILEKNYEIDLETHFGGYGKTTAELIDFINLMKKEINVLFDPIYTGKAFFGVWKKVMNGEWDGKTLVFLHTGGLQGIAGFNQKNTQKIHI